MIEIVKEVTGFDFDRVQEMNVTYFLNIISYHKDKIEFEKKIHDEQIRKYKAK